MAPKPEVVIMTAVLVLGLLAGCSGKDQQTEPTAGPEATATKDASPTPAVTPTESPEAEDTDDALPPGFPDPTSLVGQVVYDQRDADGSWHTVVGGVPLELETILGACFDGGSGDICGYSVSASVPPSAGDPPPPTVALALLLRSQGPLGDGTPTWLVLDAVVTTSPGGEPAYVEICDGADGVLIWADPDGGTGDTIPVLAAWGPDATVSSLVEVDPATLSCPWMGD